MKYTSVLRTIVGVFLTSLHPVYVIPVDIALGEAGYETVDADGIAHPATELFCAALAAVAVVRLALWWPLYKEIGLQQWAKDSLPVVVAYLPTAAAKIFLPMHLKTGRGIFLAKSCFVLTFWAPWTRYRKRGRRLRLPLALILWFLTLLTTMFDMALCSTPARDWVCAQGLCIRNPGTTIKEVCAQVLRMQANVGMPAGAIMLGVMGNFARMAGPTFGACIFVMGVCGASRMMAMLGEKRKDTEVNIKKEQ